MTLLYFTYNYQTLGEGQREHYVLVLWKKRLVNLVVDVKLGKSYTINGFVSPYWQYILKDIKKGTLIFFFLNTDQFRS